MSRLLLQVSAHVVVVVVVVFTINHSFYPKIILPNDISSTPSHPVCVPILHPRREIQIYTYNMMKKRKNNQVRFEYEDSLRI